ncbi:pheromone A receptor-domain-containing protein [Russula aff. rugulosa BPL654]|nr:pheromone A receptor-domain-containing protein [Russula aff. rugulosa BPL654]
MPPPPNEVYTVFSFIGFVLCAIPLYWHLEARNVGTCLFMIWTGLGCLLQCINSIVWNKNMINRVPVYCDISTHIQIGLNVAVPAASLCINRQLYRAATMKTAGITDEEKRRNLIYDLLIGVGIPILQMAVEYVVSGNRYDIFEDYGPSFAMWRTQLSIVLFSAWPVAIGTVSLFYCVMSIYAFYKRRQNFVQLTTSANRGRYLRLMAISSVEILGTIPLGTYYIVASVKWGLEPWKGWAVVHSHYSEVVQIAAFIWRAEPQAVLALEMSRWSLVACAFLFFALFGLSDEAREHYCRLYNSLARRIGKSPSTPHKALLATPSLPYVKKIDEVTDPIVVQMSREKDSLSISSMDRSSTLSISMESTLINQDSATTTTLKDSADSEIVSFYTAKSFEEPGIVRQSQLAPPPGLLQTVRPLPAPPAVFLPTVRPLPVPSAPPAAFLPSVRPLPVPSVPPAVFLPTIRSVSVSVPPAPRILPTHDHHPACVIPHFPDPTKSTMPVHASSSVETV